MILGYFLTVSPKEPFLYFNFAGQIEKVKNIPNQPFVIQSNNCTFAARLSG